MMKNKHHRKLKSSNYLGNISSCICKFVLRTIFPLIKQPYLLTFSTVEPYWTKCSARPTFMRIASQIISIISRTTNSRETESYYTEITGHYQIEVGLSFCHPLGSKAPILMQRYTPEAPRGKQAELLQNDVLIHNQRANILSVLYTNDENLKEGTDLLKKNYSSIINLPGQVVASEGSTVKLTMLCEVPHGTQITSENTTCNISGELLKKKWHQLYFEPEPSPNRHAEEYKVIYSAKVRNLINQPTDGGFTDKLEFRWPLVPQYQERNGEEPSTIKHIHVPNLRAGGNVYIGVQSEHIDHSHGIRTYAEPESRLESSRHYEVSSEQDDDYVNRFNTSLEQTFNQKDVKVQIVGPEGDSVELEGCDLKIRPRAVSEEKEVVISLDIKPDHFPNFVGLVPISRILKCKPSTFERPVRVRLKSFLIPKSGKVLRFTILSKAGKGEWKHILEGTVVKSVIEYEVQHFCSHVAVVSEEDEENGEYHLFNDVWMHIQSGRVLSIFCKDEGGLKKASKVLEVEHERILPLPEEVFVSIGNTIKVEIQCSSPPGMRMASIDGSNSKFEIGREMGKMNFFAMFFRPEPHPDKIRSAEPYKVYYRATILDAGGKDVRGGFSDLLDFEWPVIQSKEPRRGAPSQDDVQPSDNHMSILTEENPIETLQQAGDFLSIEAKNESPEAVQTAKIADREGINVSNLQELTGISEKLQKEHFQRAVDILDDYQAPWEEIKDMTDFSENAFFQNARKQVLPKYDGKSLIWSEVIRNIWEDIKRELIQFLDVVEKGDISVREIISKTRLSSRQMVKKDVGQLYQLGKTVKSFDQEKLRTRQILTCQDLYDDRSVKKYFMMVQKFYSFNGNFEGAKKYERNLSNKLLKNVRDGTQPYDKRFLQIARHIEGLNSFFKQTEFIKWLRKMKDLGDFRAFCDLAMRKTDGVDLEVDKISCLMSAVTGFSPLIFDLEDMTGLEGLILKTGEVCEKLDQDKTLLDEWKAASEAQQWYEDVANVFGSTEKNSMRQVKEINKKGIYKIAHESDNITYITPMDCVQLRYWVGQKKPKEEREKSLDDLHDLNSKLMLIAGKEEENSHEISQFGDLLMAVENLADVFVKLIQSGCMLFQKWTAEIKYSKEQQGGEMKLTLFLRITFEGKPFQRPVALQGITELTKVMAETLKNWKKYIFQKRQQYYHLNEFSISQIMELCRELASAMNEANLPDYIYMLLANVAENLTINQIQEAIMKATQFNGNETAEYDYDEQASLPDSCSEPVRMMNAIRALVSKEGFSEDVSKAAVQAEGYKDVVSCVNWVIMNEDDKELVTKLCDEFNEKICFSEETTSAKFITSALYERSNKTLTDVIKKLTESADSARHDIVSYVKTVCFAYSKNTTMMSLQDYLSIDHLGRFLDLVKTHSKQRLKREMPEKMSKGHPNVIVTAKDNILSTTLFIYAKCEDEPLPSASEVLICTAHTTSDMVKRFFLRAMCEQDETAVENYPIFCLANAQELNSIASQKAEVIFTKLSQEGNLNQNYQLIVITSDAHHYLTTCMEKNIVKDDLFSVSPATLQNYITKHLKVTQNVQSASKIDKQHVGIRLVYSNRAGVGKSLHVNRSGERLTQTEEENCHISTIRCLECSFDPDGMIEKLHREGILNADPHFIHVDITPAVKMASEDFSFKLIVLGYIEGRNGRIWRRHPRHYYMIEFTEFPTSKTPLPSTHILNLIPRVVCVGPTTILRRQAEIANNPRVPLNESSFEIGMDEKEFNSSTFQRPYQYLKAYSEGKDLDKLKYDKHGFGTVQECIQILIEYCSVKNPSWTQLHNFAKFLNIQLENCEKSRFCSNQDDGDYDLKGLKKLAIYFMIKMAQDLTTPSLDIADKSQRDIADEDAINEHKVRRRWEQSSHPFVFFNASQRGGETMTFVNVNFDKHGNLLDDEGRLLEREMVSSNLVAALTLNGVPLGKAFEKYSRKEKLDELCKVIGVETPEEDPDENYELTTDNALKILAIYTRLRCNIPVLLMGETGCGKTRMLDFINKICKGANAEAENMYTLKVHGGNTVKDIYSVVKKVRDRSREIKEKFNLDTILFFDEANTTEAIYAIKEVMCDMSINGESFKDDNLKIVAACNPYKKLSRESVCKLEGSGLGYRFKNKEVIECLGDVPMRALVYRVVPLPPSIQPYIWDFGQLNDEVEKLYIKQMALKVITFLQVRQADQKFMPQLDTLNDVLCQAQKFLRNKRDECRYVSLRDVERCILAFEWFTMHADFLTGKIDKHNAEQSDRSKRKKHSCKGKQFPRRSKKFPDEIFAIAQTLGLCYHTSLEDRQAFRKHIVDTVLYKYEITEARLHEEIVCCQHVFLKGIRKEKTIACNEALRENVFMIAMCFEIGIPLYIIGKPGSSKSLAKAIIDSNMHGINSRSPLFKQLKQAQIISYQCSQHTDAKGIQNVFNQCMQLQSRQNSSSFIACVILDEIGLAEDSPSMPLKILHPLLENGFLTGYKTGDNVGLTNIPVQKVGFVGISNWSLDPAKMNRGLFVNRGSPDKHDLVQTTEGIFSAHPQAFNKWRPLVEILTMTYMQIYSKQPKEYFGLRDFYSLMKMIQFSLEKNRTITMQDVGNALHRNFASGGYFDKDLLTNALDHFKTEIKKHPDLLNDLKYTEPTTKELLLANIEAKSSCRNLLLLTNEYSVFNLLDLVLKKENFEVVFGSSFPQDHNYALKCRNINRIKVAMETGTTVVMVNMTEIHESLYDALNQHYVSFGGKFFVDLGLGCHRVKCRVHEDFRIIMIEEKEIVYEKYPIPLINRLEKHVFDSMSLLNEKQKKDKIQLQQWIKTFASIDKNFKEQDAFIGYNSDTESSIAIAMEEDDTLEKAHSKLLQSATTDAVFRLTASNDKKMAEDLQSVYFQDQHHDTLLGLLDATLEEMKSTNQKEKRLEIASFSSILNESDRQTLLKRLRLHNADLMVIKLENFQSETEYFKKLDEFFKRCETRKGQEAKNRNPGILLIQCSKAHKHGNLIACAKYSLFNKLRTVMASKEHTRQVVVAFVLLTERARLQKSSEETMVLQHDKNVEIVYVDETRPNLAILGPASKFFNMPLLNVYEKGLYELDNKTENSFFIDLPGLLKDCTQKALGKINDRENNKRFMKRNQILNKLFSSELRDKSFLKFIVNHLIQLCDQKDHWLLTEACSKEMLQEGGTFRKTIGLALKKQTAKFLAYIISVVDENNNLDLLPLEQEQNKEPCSWRHDLWIKLFAKLRLHQQDLENVENFIVQNKHPDVANFEFPFSFEIIEILSRWQKVAAEAASRSEESEFNLVRAFRDRPMHGILGIVVEDNRALKAYTNDMVRMNYHPGRRHSTYSEDESENCSSAEGVILIENIVFKFAKAKYAEWKRSVSEFQPGDFYPKFHWAFDRIKRHLDIVARILSITSKEFAKEKTKKITDDDLIENDWIEDITRRLFESFLKQLHEDSRALSNEKTCSSWKLRATAAQIIFRDLTLIEKTSAVLKEKWKPLSLVLLFLNQLLPSVAETSPLYRSYLNVMFSQAKQLCRGPLTTGIRTKAFLKLLCSVLTRAYDKIELRLKLEWNDALCRVCGKIMQEPIRLECGHFICECLKQAVKCPVCSEKVSRYFKPERVHLTKDQKQELSNFKINCTGFFLRYLSEFCFDDLTDNTISKTLFSEFLLKTETELKHKALDLNFNMRSHIFTLLYRNSKEFGVLLADHIKINSDLILVAIASFEREEIARVKDDKIEYIQKANLAIKNIWDEMKSGTWNTNLLQRISEMRCILKLVFPYLHCENGYSADMKDLIKNVKLLVVSDASNMMRNYLTKHGCARLGTEWFSKFLEDPKRHDLVPSYLRSIEPKEVTDYWALAGKIYCMNRDEVWRSPDQKACVEKILKIVTGNENSNPDEILQYLLVYIGFDLSSRVQLIPLRSLTEFPSLRTLPIDLNLLLKFWKESGRSCDQRQMWLFQLMVIAVATIYRHCKKFTNLLNIIGALEESETLFLPTMPEHLYFAVPHEFRTVGNNDYGVEFNDMYECPNGHLYTIGDCTRAVASAICPDCGATIGGVGYDKPAEGNRRVNIEEKSQAGYRLHIKGENVDNPDERIPKHAVPVIRFMIHSSMLLGLLTDRDSHISVPLGQNFEETSNILVKQLWDDVKNLSATIEKNLDDTLNLFHQIFLHMFKLSDEQLQKNDDLEDSCYIAWTSTANRKKWERGFYKCFLSGDCFQSIDEKINEGWNIIKSGEDLGSAVFYRLVHDLPIMEDDSKGFENPEIWTNPAFWQRIEHPSIDHFKQFVRGSNDGRGGVLRLILEKEDLKLLRYLYPVIKLQSKLVQRYRHELDMDRSEKKTFAEARRELQDDPEISNLFDIYEEAWNKMRRNLAHKMDRKNRYRMYFTDVRENKTPIGIALPSARGCGQYAKRLADLLIDIQNKFLAECDQFTECKLKEVDVTELDKEDVVEVNLEKDFLSNIQMHTKYERTEREGGVFHEMSYNIDALEKEVQEKYVRHKRILRKETLPCMQYKQDAGIGPEWLLLLDKQEKLPAKTVHQVENLIPDLHNADIYESVRILANAIGFLSKHHTNEETIRDYLEKELLLDISHVKVIPQGVAIKHTLSLYNLLSWHKAVKFVQQGLNPYQEVVPQESQSPLSKDLREEAIEVFKRTNVKLLQQLLNEILIQAPEYSPEWKLFVDIFPCFNWLYEDSFVDSLQEKMPNELKFKHIVALFNLSVEFCQNRNL